MTTATLAAPGRPAVGRPDLGARLGPLAALCGVVSVVVHLMTLDTGSLASTAMAALALVCLPCAWHLWTRPTSSVWVLTALLDLAMLGIHVAMVTATPSHAGAHDAHAQHVHWTEPACLVMGLVAASFAMSAAVLHQARTGGRSTHR